jgi:PhnB protein
MSVTSIHPYINLNGDSAAALAFYAAALGGEVRRVMHWRELPPEYGCAPEDEGRVMHAELGLGDQSIFFADRPSSRHEPIGGNVEVHLGFASPKDLDAAFARLVEGGETRMAPHDAFWGDRFAALRDRFGIVWTLSAALA